MNEKRFRYEYSPETAMIVITDNQQPYPNQWSMCNIKQTVRTLNEFNKENEQLRKRNKFLEEYDGRIETFAYLKEENEQLQKDLKCEEMQIEQWQTEARKLADENEQLRKEHQEMLEKYVLLRLKIGEVLNDE